MTTMPIIRRKPALKLHTIIKAKRSFSRRGRGGKPINQDEGFIFDRCYIGCHENIFYEDPLFLEQVDWLLREELETKN